MTPGTASGISAGIFAGPFGTDAFLLRQLLPVGPNLFGGVEFDGVGDPDMRDPLSNERRSWNMSRIRGKDTTPEKVVRSVLHRMGYRFRLHGQKLRGMTAALSPPANLACLPFGSRILSPHEQRPARTRRERSATGADATHTAPPQRARAPR